MLGFQSCVSEEPVCEHMFGNGLFSSAGVCVLVHCVILSLSLSLSQFSYGAKMILLCVGGKIAFVQGCV